MATVYRPELFPLLERALTDGHKPCRDAAWRVLALAIHVQREDGEWVSRPRLFDRLTAQQRASLHARLPRVAGLPAEEALRSAEPAPPPAHTTRTARPPAPTHRNERVRSRTQASATKQRASRTQTEKSFPIAAHDLSASLDGLSLVELARAARDLAAEAERSALHAS